MGITADLLKTRVSKPTPGKWCTGFSAAKKYAQDKKLPLIAVWSNGDACGHCKMFETAVMNSTFTKWMSKSGCIFWFGCSEDTTSEEKHGGEGYKFCKNSTLSTYPFVRVWWKEGKVDKAASGDDWIGASASGYKTFINQLEKLLKAFFDGGTIDEDDECDCTECSTYAETVTALSEQVQKIIDRATSVKKKLDKLAKELAKS